MSKTARPPRDDLFRGHFGSRGVAVRATPPVDPAAEPDDQGEAPEAVRTLFGHFAVFGQWTEIASMWEGNFMEQIAPGAFRKTFKESRDEIKCLYEHGFDYFIGNKPLGPFTVLEEDGIGARYEVPLLDTHYCEELIPGLEAGLYGASFRFRVMREDYVEEPGASDHNPKGLPERTIKEIQCFEGGPVTFGAYAGATSGVRSLCDEFLIERFARNPERTRALAEARAERVAARGGEPEDDFAADDLALAEAGLAASAEALEAEAPLADEPTDLEGDTDAPETDLPDEVESDDAPPAEEEAGRRDDTPAEAPDGRSTPDAAPLYLGQPFRKPGWLLP